MTRFRFLALMTCLATSAPAMAQTVQVVVMSDTDAPGTPALEESLVEGCLDALFEAGFIATNARPMAGVAGDFLGFEPGTGTVGEYVDLVLLVFASFGREGDAILPPACRYRLLAPGDGAELGSGRVQPARQSSSGADEAGRACRATGAAVVAAAFTGA